MSEDGANVGGGAAQPYYLEPWTARHADTWTPRRESVDDALRDLSVRYYRRGRWRGPVARSWRGLRVR